MKTLTTLLFLLCYFAVEAQITLSGKIIDNKGNPIVGASVYLDNTLDGSSTDSSGKFKFTTTEKGNQTLVATAVGFSNAGMQLNLSGDKTGLSLILKSTAKTLEEVTITAGAFEASNDKDKTVLKPLYIFTTACSQAD
ncbi:MAG: carboxypeptidase-like regulatory domain-containing protein, partial [Bacteroidetes bacterium]|nr:carboxypeptidase-like regulatory domain-containing protein [Bacteroidota bacterium]